MSLRTNYTNTIIAVYTVAGVIIGLVLGYGLKGIIMAIIGGVIFGAIGFYLGAGKAFSLKHQAQMALCQATIEQNTRK